MNFINFFLALPCKTILPVFLVLSLLATPAYSLDSEDSQIFIMGFNAYQKKDFQLTVDTMGTLLQKYPDTPLRDMAILWLARANYKAGQQQEAAKYMAQFFREYPGSPLQGIVEDELVALAGNYAKGRLAAEGLMAAEPAVGQKKLTEPSEAESRAAAKKAEEMRLAVEKAAVEKARQEKEADEKAAAEKAAAEKTLAEKLAREKAEAEGKAAAKKPAEMGIVPENAVVEKAASKK